MNNLKKIELGKNVNLTLIPESKFKTNLISVYIIRKLQKKTAIMP